MNDSTNSLPVYYTTREEWLNAFAELARPVFANAGHELPLNVRFSIGFGSGGSRSKSAGECWSDEASGDGHFEIFIMPTADSDARIADIATHELCHAALGLKAGHGKAFKALATAVGLTGQMKATVAGTDWHRWAGPILTQLGAMPYAAIATGTSSRKKKKTYLVSHTCDNPDCGRQVWITKKNFDGLDTISCIDPDCDGVMQPAQPDDENDE
jgi:predicted SprT family Zn-dependent metalloprotease